MRPPADDHLDLDLADGYDLTGQWLARDRPTAREIQLAAMVDVRLGHPARLLELGAGFGGFAVAAARHGHRVIAVERSAVRARYAAAQARRAGDEVAGRVTVVQGDFRYADVPGPFDAVVCWNLFGCGPAADDLPLLHRIAGWLGPGGSGYVDVFDPQWWDGIRQLAVSPTGLRKLVTARPGSGRFHVVYWAPGDPTRRASETVRCHWPAEVRDLAGRAGLTGRCGPVDERRGTYLLEVRR